MALKFFRPITPSRRGMVGNSFEGLSRKEPEKSLLLPLKKRAGRNNQGRITTRHQGGGAKRMLRIIDFKRDKVGVAGKVIAIEYDPNRTARIALVLYADKEKRYIICPDGLSVGDTVVAGPKAEVRPGNALPLKAMPVGVTIHNLELNRGRGGRLVRSAGVGAQLMAKEAKYALVRMPSGELRRIDIMCMATIGQVGNLDHSNVKLGKAGKSRLMGKRPAVRGSAMSPRDHPHGGGEGRCGEGMPGPKTPWGKPARGYRTRRNKRTNNMIVKRKK
ncbi:MAG: 50S ribosomal protein L2 [Dehalococcoidia bacterium]|nr:50S ribosomal protein L2 [Dehalococcoidia bacterium]